MQEFSTESLLHIWHPIFASIVSSTPRAEMTWRLSSVGTVTRTKDEAKELNNAEESTRTREQRRETETRRRVTKDKKQSFKSKPNFHSEKKRHFHTDLE